MKKGCKTKRQLPWPYIDTYADSRPLPLGEKGLPVLQFFTSLQAITMYLTHVLLNLAPVGMAFLIARNVIEIDMATVEKVGWFNLTACIGFLIQGLLVLPSCYGMTKPKASHMHTVE